MIKNRLPLATKNTPKSNEAVNKIMDGFADIHRYTKWSFEPSDAKEGTVAYADGDNWNPGKGAGLYKQDAAGDWEYMGVSFGEDNILRHDTDQTVTAQHTFNPSSEGAPFSLGTNAQGQLITGLNAELLDGHPASDFLASGGTLDADTLDGHDSSVFARKDLYNEFTFNTNQFKVIRIAGWYDSNMSNWLELTGANSGYSTTWFFYQYKPDSSYADYAAYFRYYNTDVFAMFPAGDIWASRYIQAGTGFYCGNNAGVSGTFTTADSKTVTVNGGIITGIA